jgi:hypothetical protein
VSVARAKALGDARKLPSAIWSDDLTDVRFCGLKRCARV